MTEEELNALTVAKLKTLARENGITLTATTKAAIIAEIIAALAEAADPEETEPGTETETETQPGGE